MALESGFNLGTAYAKVLIDESGVDAGLSSVSKKFGNLGDSLAKSLQSVGSQLSGLGAALTGLGAPAAAGFTKAIFAAKDFDSALQNIAAVMGLTAQQTKELGYDLNNIGSNSIAGPQAVADAYYDIVGGVADATTHMAILQAAVKTSEAGQASLTGTTRALISVMNAYGLSADKAAMVSDVLTRTVGMGVGTMDEFASALPMVTGLANSLGISFEDVGKMMAYLTTQGNSASESATQLSSLMVAMLKPNEKMAKALKELGFQTGAAAIKQLGLAGAYKAIAGTQTAQTEGIAELTGRVEALRAVTALGGDGVESFFSKFTDGVNGATEAARDIQLNDWTAQWELLSSMIQSTAIEVGEALAPALNNLMQQIKPIIASIMEWVGENPELIQGIALIAGGLVTIGPLLIGVGLAISAIGTVIGFILSPLGLVIAAVAAFAVAFATNFGGLRDLLQPVIDKIVELWGVIKPKFDDLVKTFGEATVSATMLVNMGLLIVIDTLRKAAAAATDLINIGLIILIDTLKKASDAVQSLINISLIVVIDTLNKASISATQLGAVIQFLLISTLNNLSIAAQTIIKAVTDWIEQNGFLVRRIEDLIITIALVKAGILAYNVVTTLASSITTALASGTSLWAAAMAALSSPIVAATAAVYALIAAYHELQATTAYLEQGAQDVGVAGGAAIQQGLTHDEFMARAFDAAVAQFGDLGARLYWDQGYGRVTAEALWNRSVAAANGGARAYGGSVAQGMKYTVGERGPETFTAPANGSITPNGEGGGGGVHIETVNINASTEAGGRAAARGFKEELEDLWRGRGNG